MRREATAVRAATTSSIAADRSRFDVKSTTITNMQARKRSKAQSAPDTDSGDDSRRAPTQHRSRSRANGEGSIYQRADGTWCAAIPVEGGKRRVLYGKTRQEVAAKLNKA